MTNDIVVETSIDWNDDEWSVFSKWLIEHLSTDELTVFFTKKDGTEREMHCTLKADKLPLVETTEKKERKKSNDVLAVFDLDANGWRSFILRSVKKVIV